MIRLVLIIVALLGAAPRADAVLFSTQGPAPAVGFLLLHTGNGKITLHQGGSLQCHSC